MTQDIKELVKRLHEEADRQHDLAHDCDCAPEATANWAAMLDICSAADTLEALAEWKRQVLASEATWDIQAVGRIIKVPLGGNIFSAIQPALEALAGEVEQWRAAFNRLQERALAKEQALADCAAERDRLKGEVELLKANPDKAAGRYAIEQSQRASDLQVKLYAAEAERDRLKAALSKIKALGYGAPGYKLGRNIRKAVEIAAKALGDESN